MRLALVALALLITGCSSVPSYEGGPTLDEPYGIVQPEEGVKLWEVDGKPTKNRLLENYVAPGPRRIKFRVDYPIEDESQHPFEYIDYPIDVEAGLRYRVSISTRTPFEKGPPYELDQKVTKIRGYTPAAK